MTDRVGCGTAVTILTGRSEGVQRRQFIGLMAAGIAGGVARVGAAVPPPLGKPAPDFSVTLTDGRFVSLRDFRGKPVLVNFWSSG